MPVPADGTHTQENYDEGTRYLAADGSQTGTPGTPVDDSAGNTGRGVNVLPEEKGLFVVENIAQNPSERAGDYTHNYADPHGVARGEGFLNPDNDKQSQPQGVEYEKHPVIADKHLPEQYHNGQRYAGDA